MLTTTHLLLIIISCYLPSLPHLRPLAYTLLLLRGPLLFSALSELHGCILKAGHHCSAALPHPHSSHAHHHSPPHPQCLPCLLPPLPCLRSLTFALLLLQGPLLFSAPSRLHGCHLKDGRCCSGALAPTRTHHVLAAAHLLLLIIPHHFPCLPPPFPHLGLLASPLVVSAAIWSFHLFIVLI